MTFTDLIRITDRTDQPSPGSIVAATISWLQLCAERRRQRLALLELSDDLLADIGVSRAAAIGEASKPWWRV